MDKSGTFAKRSWNKIVIVIQFFYSSPQPCNAIFYCVPSVRASVTQFWVSTFDLEVLSWPLQLLCPACQRLTWNVQRNTAPQPCLFNSKLSFYDFKAAFWECKLLLQISKFFISHASPDEFLLMAFLHHFSNLSRLKTFPDHFPKCLLTQREFHWNFHFPWKRFSENFYCCPDWVETLVVPGSGRTSILKTNFWQVGFNFIWFCSWIMSVNQLWSQQNKPTTTSFLQKSTIAKILHW